VGLVSEVTRLLAELVARPSPTPPGSTESICEFIAATLEACGYAVAIHTRSPGVANVVARIGTGRPVLAFNSHVDTVAPGTGWRTDPYVLSPIGGGLHAGLGAVNCKGSAATQLWVAQQVARLGGPRHGTLIFSFAGDEERLGPDGTQFLAEAGHLAPDMLVMAAPTSNTLMVEERGVVWARLTTHGRGAHAGDPSAGDNAILRMARLLNYLDETLGSQLATRVLGEHRSTLSIGTISGGANTNVVPDQCVVTLDRRLLPAEESVESCMQELQQVLSAAGEPTDAWRLERITGTNGFRMSPEQPLVRAFADAVASVTGRGAQFRVPVGASDARFLSDSGAQIVIFGPGDDRQGHAVNETVEEAGLVEACAIQYEVVRQLLGCASLAR
jgi:acetylornithine deacetylase/succinyl-diaminopimelate desuccinylase family protein